MKLMLFLLSICSFCMDSAGHLVIHFLFFSPIPTGRKERLSGVCPLLCVLVVFLLLQQTYFFTSIHLFSLSLYPFSRVPITFNLVLSIISHFSCSPHSNMSSRQTNGSTRQSYHCPHYHHPHRLLCLCVLL